jgi:hypothetical protein
VCRDCQRFPGRSDRLDDQRVDRHGIQLGVVHLEDNVAIRAVREDPHGFAGVLQMDLSRIKPTMRAIRDAIQLYGVKTSCSFSFDCNPPSSGGRSRVPLPDAAVLTPSFRSEGGGSDASGLGL